MNSICGTCKPRAINMSAAADAVPTPERTPEPTISSEQDASRETTMEDISPPPSPPKLHRSVTHAPDNDGGGASLVKSKRRRPRKRKLVLEHVEHDSSTDATTATDTFQPKEVRIKKPNGWLAHVSAFRKSYPDLNLREALLAAKLTYKRPEKE